MKTSLLTLMVILTLTALTALYPSNEERKALTDEEEVINLEHDWAAAMSKHDITKLSSLLTPDCINIYGNESNNALEGLKGLDKRKIYIEKNNIKYVENIIEVKAKVIGNTAIAYGFYNSTSESKGKIEKSPKIRFYDVAIKNNGKWQFVSMGSFDTAESIAAQKTEEAAKSATKK